MSIQDTPLTPPTHGGFSGSGSGSGLDELLPLEDMKLSMESEFDATINHILGLIRNEVSLGAKQPHLNELTFALTQVVDNLKVYRQTNPSQ